MDKIVKLALIIYSALLISEPNILIYCPDVGGVFDALLVISELPGVTRLNQ